MRSVRVSLWKVEWLRRASQPPSGVQVARGGRSRSAGGIHGGLSTEMVDYGVVPVFAVLMAQDDVVSGHGRIWVLFLEKVAFLGAFAESSFGEVDMVDVSTGSGCRCVLR